MDTPEGFISQEQHDAAMLALRAELSDAINAKQAEINDLMRRLDEATKSSADQVASLQDEIRTLANRHAEELDARNAAHAQNAKEIVDQANAVCNTLQQQLQASQEEQTRWKALYDASRQVIAAHESCAPAVLKTAMAEHQRAMDALAIAQLQARIASAP